MFKKYLLASTLIATTLMMTGCGNKAENANVPADTAKQEAPAKAETSYKVVEPPTIAKQGVKDNTMGYVKINPTVDFGALNVDPKDKKVEWPKDGFAAQIPSIPSGHVAEVVNTKDAFAAYVMNSDEKSFQAYYEKLLKEGYVFETPNQSWENFTMLSPTVAINLRFGQDGYQVITVRAKKVTPSSSNPAPANNAPAPAKK